MSRVSVDIPNYAELGHGSLVVTYNVNMIGLYGVGKTSIINKLKKNIFVKSYKPTEEKKILKHTLSEKVKELENKTVKISFRDCVGLTCANSSDLSFLQRKAHILCFIYDYDNNDSYNCIKSILETADCLYNSNRIIMVIRNKIDNKTIMSETENELNEQFKQITSINDEIIFIKDFSAKKKSIDKIEKIFIKAIELYREYYGQQPPPGSPKTKKQYSKADAYNTELKKKMNQMNDFDKMWDRTNKSDEYVKSNGNACCVIL